MARTARGRRKRFRRGDREDHGATERRPERDLNDIVGDHLIPEDQHGATSRWQPMRRGDSPHHRA